MLAKANLVLARDLGLLDKAGKVASVEKSEGLNRSRKGDNLRLVEFVSRLAGDVEAG